VEIRDARRDELIEILKLLIEGQVPARRETAPTIPRPTHVAAFEAIASDPNQRLVCAVADGMILGIMQLAFIPGLARDGAWRMEIEGMRVRVEQRSQGIGEQMIRWATDRARERECSVVQLTSDASRVDAHRFYTRLGFRNSHLGFKLWL
jgi:ribosomal protein S18 acetylase RimI-like enzyme